MHKYLPALFGFGLALVPFQTSQASLLLYYSFDNEVLGAVTNGETISNFGTLGTPGTFSLGSGAGNAANFITSGIPAGFGNSGRAIQFIQGSDGYARTEAANIATSFLPTALSLTPSTAYTAMAWVNFANATGDNMVFGQNGVDGNTPTLHLGSRGGSLHSGHWGDDLGPDQGFAVNSLPGTWHHVAYTNDTAGTQQIYFDGNLVVGPGATGTGGSMDLSQLVLIGSSNNGGSFNGMVDEVKVFNTVLTPAEIQSARTVVPEPASIALLAIGGGLFARRRRAAH